MLSFGSSFWGRGHTIRLLRDWGTGLLFFLGIAVVALVLRFFLPEVAIFQQAAEQWLPQGPWRVALYVVVSALLTCAALPRQMVSFVGGSLFGLAEGLLLATIAVTLGCIFAFGFARLLGQQRIERRFGSRLHGFNQFLCRGPFVVALLVRLFPSGNNLLFSLFAGVSRIPALPFFCGSCLGYIPQNFIFALLGSGTRVDPFWRFSSGAILFVCSGLLGAWLYRRYRNQCSEQTPAE